MKKIFVAILMCMSLSIFASCAKKDDIEVLDGQGEFKYDNYDFVGEYELDIDASNELLSEDENLYFYLGSLLRTSGANLILREDGTIEYYAGGLCATGEYEFSDDDNTSIIYASLCSMNDDEHTYNITIEINEDKLIMHEENDLDLIWIKK